LNSNLKNGPFVDRECTDHKYLFIFIFFMLTIFIISLNGFMTGDPGLIGVPHDNQGNFCGISPNYEDFKLIFYPEKNNPNIFVCVEKCPETLQSFIKCNCKYNANKTQIVTT